MSKGIVSAMKVTVSKTVQESQYEPVVLGAELNVTWTEGPGDNWRQELADMLREVQDEVDTAMTERLAKTTRPAPAPEHHTLHRMPRRRGG